MGHVSLRAAPMIALTLASREFCARALNRMTIQRVKTLEQQMKEILQRTLLDRQFAVHVGFTQGQRRIEHHSQRQAFVVQSHRNPSAITIPGECMPFAPCVDDNQVALSDHGLQHRRQKRQGARRWRNRSVHRRSSFPN
ncbi:hypothetical protein [Novosphingobium pentaromativorans]|nr:hypothetical protein [Novosphingobium pentaromativorans]